MKGAHVKTTCGGSIFKTEPMPKAIRIIPPVCLSKAILELLGGKLKMSQEFVGRGTVSDDGQVFTIFRQIKKRKAEFSEDHVTFIVRFRFARLSHRANKVASIIPMLVIAGTPGFVQKLYAVNKENGFWQGMYEWRSVNHLEAYQKSFVYRMMNKRALKGTVQPRTISNCAITDLIEPDHSRKGKIS